MKKYIILALVALLAAVLFVACDNDVKVDNNTAYTEVLESEGAFVVNGKGYDTLQSAIQAAVGGKTSAEPDPVLITMTRNITSRPVVIPEDSEIKLDLGGYKLTFIDVEETALSVSDKAFFVLGNGAVALHENSNNLKVLDVKGTTAGTSTGTPKTLVSLFGVIIEGNVSVSGAALNAAGLVIGENTVIDGKVTATGTEPATTEEPDRDVVLVVANTLSDVSMTNAHLHVLSTGHVTLTALAGTNYFVSSYGDSSITNMTETVIDVVKGLYYIERTASKSYYGSLQEALDSLDADDLTIDLLDNDASTVSVVAKKGKAIKIDLNGHTISQESASDSFKITADAALTIVNTVTISENDGTIYGSINAGNNDVTITGNSTNMVVVSGAVTAGRLTASYATFQDDIFASVSANISDSNVGYGDGDGVFAPVITISSSTLNVNYLQKTEVGSDVAATSVSVTNSYGNIGSIVASNGITLSSPQAEDSSANHLTVTMMNAGTSNILITGHYHETYTDYVKVSGAVVNCGNLTASYAVFSNDVTATGLINISNSTIGPVSNDTVTIQTSSADSGATKAITMSAVKFTEYTDTTPDPDKTYYADVKATAGGSISMTGCTGTAGDITATNVAGSIPGTIEIDNSASGSEILTTGAIYSKDSAETSTKFGNIYVYGLTNSTVTVTGFVKGATVTAGSAEGAFGATFDEDITASVAAYFYNSVVGKVDGDINTDVFAPQITIADSKLYADDLMGIGQAADSVTITGPVTGSIVDRIATKDLSVTDDDSNLTVDISVKASGVVTITGGTYEDVTISGSGNSTISGGSFIGTFKYTGTGTLVLNGTYSGNNAATSSNYSLYFGDIDAVTENVDIKCAYIEESDPEDVLAIIRRINQDAAGQCVYINFNPGMIATLTGYQEFDMTSAKIFSYDSAYLNFDMDYDGSYISSGLIVGSGYYPSASVTFNCYNGFGRPQINLTGCIGLVDSYDTVVYSTTNNAFVYRCTVTQVEEDVYNYSISGSAIEGSLKSSSLYEYRNNGN